MSLLRLDYTLKNAKFIRYFYDIFFDKIASKQNSNMAFQLINS